MDWPQTRVVARLTGSLPMGGVVPDTPIHAFAQTPAALALGPAPALQPRRRDIELGGLLAFAIDEVVTAEEADRIVAASEVFGYRDEAPGIATPPGMRLNKSVHWVADEALLGPILARIRHLLPPEIDGAPLHGRLSHRINMYRYDDQDVFNRHIDGDWPGYGLDPDRTEMLEWGGALRSCLSMLLYLNGPEDGVAGGQTRLLARDGGWTDVTPRKGAALFFRHGFSPDSVIHIGARVSGPVPKYLARINVMYGRPD
ncbi:hypothetical protein [Hydrogenophaga sp. MI9]|uniref:hypothetical protein n=1 Tax=Hydrogenophaga sp. MI9 TaxID=3453719 RepID=UPI003EEECA1E